MGALRRGDYPRAARYMIARLARQLRYLVRALLQRRRIDAELDEELRYHLEREVEERVRRGERRPAAERAAQLQFGHTTAVREAAIDARGLRWLEDLLADGRLALRRMRLNPGFTVITVLIVSFGIGATTLTFSAVNGVLLRPLPFPHAASLATLTFRASDHNPGLPDPEAYAAIEHAAPSLAAVGAYAFAGATLAGAAEPEDVRILRLTPELVQMLGLVPLLGRTYTGAEAGRGDAVAVLDHAFWLRAFGGDSGVVGQIIRLDGAPYTVIGVMPPGAVGPRLSRTDVFLPLPLHPLAVAHGRPVLPGLIVRVRDGVPLAAAQADVAAHLHVRGVQVLTGAHGDLTPELVPLTEITTGDARAPLFILLAAAAFVLALVAANVATLLLARGASRTHEMAMRRALGAGRERQIRQLLTETALLIGVGATVGVSATAAGLRLFKSARLEVIPRVADIGLDWRVMIAAIVITAATALTAGVIPALLASSEGTGRAGRATTGRMARRARAGFGALQVAVSVMLLVGAGLVIKGFLRVVPTAPGFTLDDRLVVSVHARDGGAFEDPALQTRAAFAEDVVRRITALPGVIDAGFTSMVPLERVSTIRAVTPATSGGETVAPARAHERSVSANYFALLGIPVVLGRSLSASDGPGAEPVAVVNQTMAARLWPGRTPLGQVFRFPGGPGAGARLFRVVGVVRDARFEGTDTKTRPEFYVPYAQAPTASVNFVVHSREPADPLAAAVKRQIWTVDPTLPIDDVTTLASVAGESVKEARFYSIAMAVLAAVALSVAAAGMYGMVSYGVAQRRREIGIRLALGSPTRRVGMLVLGSAAWVTGGGLAAGLVAAWLLTKFIAALLLEVSPRDATVFAAAGAGLVIMAIVASLSPLRSALKTDPALCLRAE